jgi:hypothetical protein
MALRNYIINKIRSKMKSMKNKARDDKRAGKDNFNLHKMDDSKSEDSMRSYVKESLGSFPSTSRAYSKRANAGRKTSDRFRKEGTYFDKAGTRRQTERSKIDRRKPSNAKLLAETALETTGVVVPAGAIGVMARQYNEKVKKDKKAAEAKKAIKKPNRKTKLTKDSVPLSPREIEQKFQGKY